MKQAPMSNFFNYEIKDNYILDKENKFYFFRFNPPNINIMTTDEFQQEIRQLQMLLDSLNCDFQLFVCDKTEDLSRNKQFYETFKEEFDYLTSDIIHQIQTTEAGSKSIQRAYYFIFKTNEKAEFRRIHNILVGKGYDVSVAEKKELALIMRNFILREFSHFDILLEEDCINKNYEKLLPKQKKKISEELYFKSELTKRLSPMKMQFKPYDCVQNDFFRKVIMIKNIPSRDTLGYFKDLSQLKNTSFSMRMSKMDNFNIARLVDKQANNNKLFNKHSTTESVENLDKIKELTEFYQKLNQEKNKVFLTNIYIEIYGNTLEQFQENISNVFKELSAIGVSYDVLVDNQKQAFRCMYPLGQDHFKASSNNLPSNTLASFYPFSYSSRLDPHGFLIGETVDGGNMFIDFDIRDAFTANGNICIAGSSGFGKTYLMKKILEHYMMKGVNTFTLDPENEYGELYQNLGGSIVNCTDNKARINIFEVRQLKGIDEDLSEDEMETDVMRGNQAVFYQHLSWLKDFFNVLFPTISTKEISALIEYVKETYFSLSIDENTDFTTFDSHKYPIFTDLYKTIEKDVVEGIPRLHMIDKKTAKDILLIIKDCYDGSLGFLLNGHTNIKNDNNICFSILDLLNGAEDRKQAILFNIMTYIWNKITLRKSQIVFNIDELHVFLEDGNVIVAKYIKDFTKRVRKYGASIITGTQNFSDMNSPKVKHITMGIINNCNFKFVFYPGDADVKVATELLQLKGGEIDCVNKKLPHHCLLKAGRDKYYMKIGTFPFEKEIFGSISSGLIKEAS